MSVSSPSLSAVDAAERETLDVEAEVAQLQKASERQLSKLTQLNASLVKKLRAAEAASAALLDTNKELEAKNADLVDRLSEASTSVALLAEKEKELKDVHTNLSAATADLQASQLEAKTAAADRDTAKGEASLHMAAASDSAKHAAELAERLEMVEKERDEVREQVDQLNKETKEAVEKAEKMEEDIKGMENDLTKSAEAKDREISAAALKLQSLEEEKSATEKKAGEEMGMIREELGIANVKITELTQELSLLEEKAKKDVKNAREEEISAAKEAVEKAVTKRDEYWMGCHSALHKDMGTVLDKHVPEDAAKNAPTVNSVGGDDDDSKDEVAPELGLASQGVQDRAVGADGEEGNTADVPDSTARGSLRSSVLDEEVVEEMVVEPRDGDDVLEEVEDEVPLTQEEAESKRLELSSRDGVALSSTESPSNSMESPAAPRGFWKRGSKKSDKAQTAEAERSSGVETGHSPLEGTTEEVQNPAEKAMEDAAGGASSTPGVEALDVNSSPQAPKIRTEENVARSNEVAVPGSVVQDSTGSPLKSDTVTAPVKNGVKKVSVAAGSATKTAGKAGSKVGEKGKTGGSKFRALFGQCCGMPPREVKTADEEIAASPKEDAKVDDVGVAAVSSTEPAARAADIKLESPEASTSPEPLDASAYASLGPVSKSIEEPSVVDEKKVVGDNEGAPAGDTYVTSSAPIGSKNVSEGVAYKDLKAPEDPVPMTEVDVADKPAEVEMAADEVDDELVSDPKELEDVEEPAAQVKQPAAVPA